MPAIITSRGFTPNPRTVTLTITETGVLPLGEITIPIPPWARSFRCDHHLQAGGAAATIQPEYGYLPGWVTGQAGHIDAAAAAAADHTVIVRRNLPVGVPAFYLRSMPDVPNVGGTILHRVTLYALPEG